MTKNTRGGYSVRVNGLQYQWADYTLDDAAVQVADAHRNGDRWDVRRRTGRGVELRVLTADESQQLIERVKEIL